MAKKIGLSALIVALVTAGAIYYVNRHREKPFIENIAVPVYPGSQTEMDTFSQRLKPRDRARLVKAFVYTTADPPAKVISFYKQNLAKDKTAVIETSRHGIPEAVFRTEAGGPPRLVMIRANDDTNKTEILISSVMNQR